MSESIPEQIERKYLALCQNLNRLSSLLHSLPAKQAVVSPTAPTLKGNDAAEVKSILIDPVFDADACQLAAGAYKDIHIQPDLSQKVARRTIGAIALFDTSAASEVAELVSIINQCKAEIKRLVISNYVKHTERFAALREACPGVMTVHLYRQIRCYEHKSVKSMRFTWQRKETVSRVNKKKFRERIDEELRFADGDSRLPLTQLALNVAQIPECQLRIRRPTPVQPMVNVNFFNGESKTVPAPLPFIILQSEPVEFKMLSTFKDDGRRQVRADKVKSEVIGMFAGSTVEIFNQ